MRQRQELFLMNDPVHGKQADLIQGPWVRWSRYELLDGVVVPAG